MPRTLTLSDLGREDLGLDDLAGAPIEVWPGDPYVVKTRAFALGRDLLSRCGPRLSGELPPGRLFLLQDDNTRAVAGDAVADSLRQAGRDVVVHTLPCAPGEHIEATDEAVEAVQRAIRDAGDVQGVVAVGSGTINDLAKLGSFRQGLPYAVVATAASMNGYTSAIAAILVDGIKRSLDCAPPILVVADLDVVAAAPAALTLAGLGDLLSKPVSSGDWRLGHLLLGEAFTEVPLALVETAFRRVQAAARGIGAGEPEAVGTLLVALLLSGISMACAGTSSPASGGEHLISHYWDMTAPWRGRHVGLHGAQVGVTTLVSATLYSHLRRLRPTPASIADRLARLEDVETYAQAAAVCPEALQPGIRAEIRKKHPSAQVLEARLTQLARDWDAIWEAIDRNLQGPQAIRAVLVAAGAPVTAAELGIPEWEMREAFRRARDIRARYTVLDLAWELGALERLEDTVLGEAGVLG